MSGRGVAAGSLGDLAVVVSGRPKLWTVGQEVSGRGGVVGGGGVDGGRRISSGRMEAGNSRVGGRGWQDGSWDI